MVAFIDDHLAVLGDAIVNDRVAIRSRSISCRRRTRPPINVVHCVVRSPLRLQHAREVTYPAASLIAEASRGLAHSGVTPNSHISTIFLFLR